MRLVSDLQICVTRKGNRVIASIHRHKTVKKCNVLKILEGRLLEQWRFSAGHYVSPAQRHSGEDRAFLAARHDLYLRARALKPARWSGARRNWDLVGAVTINPERVCVIKAHLEKVIQPMAV